MAFNDRDEKDEGNEDFDTVSRMAQRLKLKGRERDRYIDQHMRGLGYRSVPTYVRPDDGDDDDEDSGRSRYSFRSSRGRGRGGPDDDDW